MLLVVIALLVVSASAMQCWNNKCGCPGNSDAASWCRFYEGTNPHIITSAWCNENGDNCNKCSGTYCTSGPLTGSPPTAAPPTAAPPTNAPPTGTCWYNKCGCPGAGNGETWCRYTEGTDPHVLSSEYCSASQSNCEGKCPGTWCANGPLPAAKK